jgi:hypothetical protein
MLQCVTLTESQKHFGPGKEKEHLSIQVAKLDVTDDDL